MADIKELKDKDLNEISGGNNDGQNVCPDGYTANIRQDKTDSTRYWCSSQSELHCINMSCPYRNADQYNVWSTTLGTKITL